MRIIFNWSRRKDDVRLSSHNSTYTLRGPGEPILFVEEKLPLHKEVRAKIRALSFASGQVLVGELQKQDLSLSITGSLEHEVTGERAEGETCSSMRITQRYQ